MPRDPLAAGAVAIANRRTRLVVRLIESAPPLRESHRYAIAQALAECRRSEDPREQSHRGSSGASTEGKRHGSRLPDTFTTPALQQAWDAYQDARAGWLAAIDDTRPAAPAEAHGKVR